MNITHTPQMKYSDERMSELGDIQGSAITSLFQAAKTSDDLLAMQRGVAFFASRLTPEAVLELGKSAEAIAWARGAVRRMWAQYDRLGARGATEREAETAGRLIHFPLPRI